MTAYSFAVLKIRDFRILLLTRLMVAMAVQAQAVIVGWQIYSLTKSPFMLGLAGLIEAIPALSCALFAGHVVDTSRPYRVLATCMAAFAANMTMLFLVGGGVIALEKNTLVICILCGVFLSGIVRSFIMPSTFSLLPRIVPRNHIPAASAWQTSGFQTGVICGPAIAGLLYGGYGPKIAWLMPLALICTGFVLSLVLSADHRNFRGQGKREPGLTSIKAGWSFILSNGLLLSVMALDMFAVLFGGAVSMLPAFADRVLHLGSEGLGLLRAAPAIGAVGTTLFFAVKPLKVIKGATLLVVVSGFGISIICFGMSTMFGFSMLFLAFSGAFDSVSMIIRQTLMQWLTPDDMRGRVSSVNSMFIISSNEIGAFESGVAAQLFGLVPSIIIGGIATLMVVAATAGISPKLRHTAVKAE